MISSGWGRVCRGLPARVAAPGSAEAATALLAKGPRGAILARGLGRSYGDCAINSGGLLIDCRFLDHFLAFDAATGILECQAGVSLEEINHLLIPQGWMLPVVPGTQQVTVGGAIANDVHGKNHRRHGSFGNHLASLRLARSDGSELECAADQNASLFAATIGGLGLTGLILSARVRLRPVVSLLLDTRRKAFDNLAELFEQGTGQVGNWEYQAAWLDPASGCRRGICFLARHRAEPGPLVWPRRRRVSLEAFGALPGHWPGRLLMKTANGWYRHAVRPGQGREAAHSVLYPLDRLPGWNALFGQRGLFQHQSVFGEAEAPAAVAELLGVVEQMGQRPTLAVGKWFGPAVSPGLMSFPTAGFSLALDFANNGPATRKLLNALDNVVASHGGRLYAAKDATMSPALFRRGYPELERFTAHIDPCFGSDFWQRMELAG